MSLRMRKSWWIKSIILLSISISFFALLNLNQPVKAIPYSGVSVKVEPILNSTSSKINLAWSSIAPQNGGTITYEVKRSTDGGSSYASATAGPTLNLTSWSDPEVPNYTNVMYQVFALEKSGTTETTKQVERTISVYPPDENTHDNFMDNTDLCRNCHSTHQAKGGNLLNQSTTTAVCLTCHTGGANSKYDVINGFTKTLNGNAPSLGGAFAHNGVAGDVWGGASTTSAHITDEYTKGAAPGGMNTSQTMGCTTCHSGHATGNYRNLKTSMTVPSGDNQVTTTTIDIVAGAKTASSTSGEEPVYMKGISSLCQSCHSDYYAGTGSGGSGTVPMSKFQTPGTYRHPVDIPLVYKSTNLTTTLPLERNPEDKSENPEKMTCLTCHYAHGTVASEFSVSAVVSGDGTPPKPLMSTALKRLNAMKLCQDCHKK